MTIFGTGSAVVEGYKWVKDKFNKPEEAELTSKEGMLRLINEVVVHSYLSVNVECFQSLKNEQAIKIKCDPTEWLEEDSTCGDNLKHGREYIGEYHKSLEQQEVYNTVEQEEELMRSYFQDSSCKSCEFRDISQFNVIKKKQNCVISSENVNNWKTKTKEILSAAIYQRRDLLAGFISAFSAGGKTDAVTEFLNRLEKVNFLSVKETVESTDTSKQNLEFIGSGTSGKGITQKQYIKAVSTSVKSAKWFDSIMTEEEWKTFTEVSKNNTSFDEAGKIVNDTLTSIGDLISTTVGTIAIACVALLFLLICVFIYVSWFRK
jgi:hypothetical protein